MLVYQRVNFVLPTPYSQNFLQIARTFCRFALFKRWCPESNRVYRDVMEPLVPKCPPSIINLTEQKHQTCLDSLIVLKHGSTWVTKTRAPDEICCRGWQTTQLHPKFLVSHEIRILSETNQDFMVHVMHGFWRIGSTWILVPPPRVSLPPKVSSERPEKGNKNHQEVTKATPPKKYGLIKGLLAIGFP